MTPQILPLLNQVMLITASIRCCQLLLGEEQTTAFIGGFWLAMSQIIQPAHLQPRPPLLALWLCFSAAQALAQLHLNQSAVLRGLDLFLNVEVFGENIAVGQLEAATCPG